MNPEIESRRLRSVSPSAIVMYRNCARLWYNNYQLSLRGPVPTFLARGTAIHAALEHFLRTGEVLVEVEVPDAPGVKFPVLQYVQAAIDYLPKPAPDPYWDPWREKGDAGIFVEQSGEMGTWTDPDGTTGPVFRQFLDLVEAYPDRATLTDHKTTSDFRYAKTPEELSVNVQLISNCMWLLRESNYTEVTLRHLYLLTSRKRPKALAVSVVVTREHVEREWQKILLTIREMDGWTRLAPKTAEALPPTVTMCSAFGGCLHKPLCYGNSGDLIQVRRSTMNEGEKMGLLDQMLKRAGKTAEETRPVTGIVTLPGQAPATAPVALGATVGKVAPAGGLAALLNQAPEVLTPERAQEAAVAAGYDPNGICPPDMPSPVSTLEEVAAANPAAEPVEAKRKRRTKLEMEAARAAEAAQVIAGPPSEPATMTVLKINQGGGPLLVPTSTTIDVAAPPVWSNVVEVESELDKIRRVLRTPDAAFACGTEAIFIDCLPGKGWPGEQPIDAIEFVAAFNALAASSAGTADYRLIKYESKGYLATAVRVYMSGLPRALYVDSRMSGADVLLETIIPYAKMVYRGVR